MKDPHEDLAARRPVWAALSALYLDTDPAYEYEVCASDLAGSDYSLQELERILLREVHPALRSNLLASVGVWEGFDIDWLADTIVRQQSRPRWLRPATWFLRARALGMWHEVAPRIAGFRDGTREFVPVDRIDAS